MKKRDKRDKQRRQRIRRIRGEQDTSYRQLIRITPDTFKESGFFRHIPYVSFDVLIHNNIERDNYIDAYCVGICEVLSGTLRLYGNAAQLKQTMEVQLPPDICEREGLEQGWFGCRFDMPRRKVYVISCITFQNLYGFDSTPKTSL